MEMRVEKSFYMLEKKDGEGEKEVFLYDNIVEAVEKISNYMRSGVAADNIELTEINIEKKEMEARVVAWSKIAEELVKRLTEKPRK
jgi:hypothetical protein